MFYAHAFSFYFLAWIIPLQTSSSVCLRFVCFFVSFLFIWKLVCTHCAVVRDRAGCWQIVSPRASPRVLPDFRNSCAVQAPVERVSPVRRRHLCSCCRFVIHDT
ncbi:hypothetical protein DFH11DRAFT_1567629 [Phellopilus nigrolimitatus]|nr:hypothetical protein DFH11DRAFT_1567629 [Phellopilus nigrolimitatus]